MYDLHFDESDRILVVAPHPDDESIGVGGLLCEYPNICHVLVMTDGRYGGEGYAPDELAAIRKKEFIRAMNLCGVSNYTFLDYKDKSLIFQKDCFDSIDFSKYSAVFLPNPNDKHSDHTATYEYAINAIEKQHVNALKIFQYEVHGPLPETNCFIDIGGSIEVKKKMIESYQSQYHTHPYVSQVFCLAQYRGCQNKLPDQLLEAYLEIDIANRSQSEILLEGELAKYKQFTGTLIKWLSLQQKGFCFADYLKERNYDSAAIYGFGILGRALFNDLKQSGFNVKYIIDRDKRLEAEGIKVYQSPENCAETDVIIVTVLQTPEKIVETIKQYNKADTMIFKDVIEEA